MTDTSMTSTFNQAYRGHRFPHNHPTIDIVRFRKDFERGQLERERGMGRERDITDDLYENARRAIEEAQERADDDQQHQQNLNWLHRQVGTQQKQTYFSKQILSLVENNSLDDRDIISKLASEIEKAVTLMKAKYIQRALERDRGRERGFSLER